MSAEPKIVGKVERKPLDSVKPNPWNPNRMTEFEMQSLKVGLDTDGWLTAQSLLVWGLDDQGNRQNIIIDGEHRWRGATELGFKTGPMVFLDGLTAVQAKALTVKMNAKRGKFQEDLLAGLLKEIQFELNVPDLPLDLGIPSEEIMRYLSFAPEPVDPTVPPAPVQPPPQGPEPAMQHGHVTLVQLFFSKEQHVEFQGLLKEMAEKLNTKNVSDTTLEVFRSARAYFAASVTGQ